MTVPNGIGGAVAAAVLNGTPSRARQALEHVWGRVGWKMQALITFTGSSTILSVCLGIAALNVVMKRESANVVERQIQTLVQTSRSVAQAVLDYAGGCTASSMNSGELKPLPAYTDEAFPGAQVSLRIDCNRRLQFLLPEANSARVGRPNWLPQTGYGCRGRFATSRNVCGQTAIQANPMIAFSNYNPGLMEIL
jgi:hypothetical protein